jgi:membrane associated rhomboid family serine protease
VFFPLRDVNPTSRSPWITRLLILSNVLVFSFQLFGPISPHELIHDFGLVPARLSGLGTDIVSAAAAWTLLSSMFLHGDLFHLGGNLLYLWIFGNNIEDILGHARFLLFYLACGLGGHALHVLTNAASPTPTIGASGAISGVLAAYLVRFPNARVVSLLLLGFFIRTVIVPASLVIGVWFLLQLLSGVFSLGSAAVGGVAWFEHIGGFLAGLGVFRILGGSRR